MVDKAEHETYLRAIDNAIREAIVEGGVRFQDVQIQAAKSVTDHEQTRRSFCPDCEGTLFEHDEGCQHITALHEPNCLCAPCRTATFGVTHH